MATNNRTMRNQLALEKRNVSIDTVLQEQDRKKALPRLLACSIQTHNDDLLEQCLKEGADINYVGPDDRNTMTDSPLINSIIYYYPLAFNELLKRRELDVNQRGIHADLPIIVATVFGHLDMVQILLEKGATFLGTAFDRLNIVKALSEEGAAFLDIAKEHLSEELKKQLEKRRLAGLLAEAIRFHKNDMFYQCLSEGADINYVGPYDQGIITNPLIDSIFFYNIPAFEELLKRGANVNQQGISGDLPINFAAAFDRLDMVQILLEKGAKFLDSGEKCLSQVITCIKNSPLLHNARWRYEDEDSDVSNETLKTQVSNFYKTKPSEKLEKEVVQGSPVIPFCDKQIHVHYEGNLAMLKELLTLNPSSQEELIFYTTNNAWDLVNNPKKFCRYFFWEEPEELQFIDTEDEKDIVLQFKMNFWNQTYTETIPTQIILHYDFTSIIELMKPMKLKKPNIMEKERSATISISSNMAKKKESTPPPTQDEMKRSHILLKVYDTLYGQKSLEKLLKSTNDSNNSPVRFLTFQKPVNQSESPNNNTSGDVKKGSNSMPPQRKNKN